MDVLEIASNNSPEPVSVPNWSGIRVDENDFEKNNQYYSSVMAFQRVKPTGTTMIVSKQYSLKEFLCMELSIVPEVEKVYATRQGDVMHIYTVVDKFDASVREKIYDREVEIIDEFSYLDFDFNVISRRGRKLSDVLPTDGFDFGYERPR